MPHQKFGGEEEQKSRKSLVLGIILMACVGLGAVAFLNRNEAKYQLETANNILRSWRCPPGGYPSGAGSGGNCLCSRCPKGHKCLGGNQPKRPCAPGKYQDVTGQNKCKEAPPGTYVPSSGASRPTPCGYGTYNSRSGRRSCTRASPGNHVPTTGAKKQTQCPVGRYQNAPGSRTCKPARRGTYVAKRGQTRPTPCHYGSFQDQVGKTKCKPVPPGNYAASKGQSRPTPCGRNTFQHCNGQMNCIPCARGLSAGAGATKCTRAQASWVSGNSKTCQQSCSVGSKGKSVVSGRYGGLPMSACKARGKYGYQWGARRNCAVGKNPKKVIYSSTYECLCEKGKQTKWSPMANTPCQKACASPVTNGKYFACRAAPHGSLTAHARVGFTSTGKGCSIPWQSYSTLERKPFSCLCLI